MKTNIIQWTIEIYPQDKTVDSSTILRTRSAEYDSFIESMVGMLEWKGYLLNAETAPDKKDGRYTSIFEFVKLTEDEQKSRVSVSVSVGSDSVMMEQDANDIPIYVPVEIVLGNHRCMSYMDAILELNRLINQL